MGAGPGIRKRCIAVSGLADTATGTEQRVVLTEARAHQARDHSALRAAVAHALATAGSNRPSVLVCHPSSGLDGLVLVAALLRAQAFVAWPEGAQQVVAGRLLRRLGSPFVARVDLQRSVADAGRLADGLSTGRSLTVFPEGTIGPVLELLPFHLGGFLAAAQAGVAEVPLALTGTRQMPPRGAVA